jgi:hypothetical protein
MMPEKKDIVPESSDYDNCIGVKEQSYAKSLSEFFDDDVKEKLETEAGFDEKSWKKHWIGMPEYEQEDNPPYKKIIISFRTKEDYEEFAKLIGQNLSDKTKSIWHPKLDRDANSLRRWIEE